MSSSRKKSQNGGAVGASQKEDIENVFKGIDRMVDTAPTYRKLFSRWENQQWSTEEIDFTEDARQWKESELFTDEMRESIIWSTSSFFLGEERVTTELMPFAIAAPNDDAKLSWQHRSPMKQNT